jgi:DNA-binding SARP family transcriptional activator
MDALWPDSPPQAAERNFKVALHRLRKVLEPDLDPKFGSSYLVLKENTLTLTDLVEETDVEAFQRLVREGRRLETQGRLRDAAAAYGRADALYGGEYLPDCSYQTWCLDQRRALVERLIEMLFWKARLHESRGGHRKAAAAYRRVIDADPVNEEAFRRLMLLNFDRGRFDAAVKAYRQCRENMARHLDLPPSPGTRAVYQKIVDASSD